MTQTSFPVMLGFDVTKPIGYMVLNNEHLPRSPDYVFSLAYTVGPFRLLHVALAPEISVSKNLVDAVRGYLKANDPEEFDCACAPDWVCMPCQERRRQAPLRQALAEYDKR